MTSIITLLRAVSRLSPRQAAYHIKRQGRNQFARRYPGAYARYIQRVANSLPALELSQPGARAPAVEIAQAVAPFYLNEYRHEIDAAARGRFSFFGQSADFGSSGAIDWHHQVPAETDFHLWRMKLGHMGFVCPMLVEGDEHHLEAVSELLRTYKERANFGVSGCFSSYWFPYSVSHRVLAILSGYMVRDRDLPQELCRDLEAFLRWNAGFIWANIEHELRNNHVERNLAALCFYFSCVGEVPRGVRRRLDREVRRVIHACLLPDGFIAERSAMYQGLAVMALDVFAKTPFLSSETRALATATHERALQAWLTMTHPDGEIALFNDSWFGEVPAIGTVVSTSEVRQIDVLPDAGYVRLESAGVFAIMDAGPIGPRWNPGHGHADFLAVEADLSGVRFLVDPGTYQYSTGPRRAFERSAQSHNGPIRSGLEPVDYVGCFRVGRMRQAELLGFEATASGAEAQGELSLSGRERVSRVLKASPGRLRVLDEWVGPSTGAKVRLTIPDEWVLEDRDLGRLVFRQGEHGAEICVAHGQVSEIKVGEWSCQYLVTRGATVVELQPEPVSGSIARLDWEIQVLRGTAVREHSGSLDEMNG